MYTFRRFKILFVIFQVLHPYSWAAFVFVSYACDLLLKDSCQMSLLQMVEVGDECLTGVIFHVLRSELFWNFRHRRTIISYRRFEATYRYQLQESSSLRRLSWILYSWVRASWIEFNNCPTRCDLFSLLHLCRQLYVFRVLTPIIRSSYNCNYSFWYWLTGSTTIRSRCWVGTAQQRERMVVDPVNQYQKL